MPQKRKLMMQILLLPQISTWTFIWNHDVRRPYVERRGQLNTQAWVWNPVCYSELQKSTWCPVNFGQPQVFRGWSWLISRPETALEDHEQFTLKHFRVSRVFSWTPGSQAAVEAPGQTLAAKLKQLHRKGYYRPVVFKHRDRYLKDWADAQPDKHGAL